MSEMDPRPEPDPFGYKPELQRFVVHWSPETVEGLLAGPPVDYGAGYQVIIGVDLMRDIAKRLLALEEWASNGGAIHAPGTSLRRKQ